MSNKFISSDNIKVFPTNYRKGYDANAGLFTERNLNYLKKLSKFEELNNYFSYTVNDNIFNFDLTLSGYRFIFSLDTDDLGTDWGTDVYAYIELLSSSSSYEENNTLLPNDSTTINILDSNSEFKGLTLTDSIQNLNNIIAIQLLTKVGNSWEICEHKDLKLDANEIRNGNGINTNIKEQFDAEIINVNTLSATLANISTAIVTTASINNATISNASITTAIVAIDNISQANIKNANITATTTINQAFIKTIGSSATTTYSEGRVENIFASTINSTNATINDMAVTKADITTAIITGNAIFKNGTNTLPLMEIVTGSSPQVNIPNVNITSTATINDVKINNVATIDNAKIATAEISGNTKFNNGTNTIPLLEIVTGATPLVKAPNISITTANITTTYATDIVLTGDITKNNYSIIVPAYDTKAKWSVLGIKWDSNNVRYLDWIDAYDGSYEQ